MARIKICQWKRLERHVKFYSLFSADATFRLSAIFEWESKLMNRTVALFGIHRMKSSD